MDHPIFIWIRRTTDWLDEATFQAQLKPHFRGRVDLWNATFDMPYREFRHRLRRIAAKTLGTVAGAELRAWDAIPDNGWVVPIDDDDWLAPYAAHRLAESIRHDIHGIVWSQSAIEIPINLMHSVSLRARRLLNLPCGWFIDTNNYMLRKGSTPKDSFQAHNVANRRYKGSPLVRVLPERLSIQNRSLASITSMGFRRRRFSQDELLRKYRRYKRLYREYEPPAREADWLATPVASMVRLMDELVPRQR